MTEQRDLSEVAPFSLPLLFASVPAFLPLSLRLGLCLLNYVASSPTDCQTGRPHSRPPNRPTWSSTESPAFRLLAWPASSRPKIFGNSIPEQLTS
ncbi:hypothetical protein K461DRAFT_84626 [Myriangium duriaei CBS 260.36]|uniref:Uncharacterized protein n=1 Tax=Myriangium duriaei CBS 260.36 TaxID=1168546 RepID=A0A9P4J5S9_9PEZI|nr:hypothetical protein K461DRAFT_84626 [Myriangium duriaei CBS 260.36]